MKHEQVRACSNNCVYPTNCLTWELYRERTSDRKLGTANESVQTGNATSTPKDPTGKFVCSHFPDTDTVEVSYAKMFTPKALPYPSAIKFRTVE